MPTRSATFPVTKTLLLEPDMVTTWYYGHDGKKLGPFSQAQLKELAAAGTILPIDTVWLEGNEKSALASQVKNLFPTAIANAPPASDVKAPVAEAPIVPPPAKA